MNGNNDVLRYVNSVLIKLNHSVRGTRTDEIDDLCLVLNLLYRVKYRLPFLLTEKGEFLSDNLDTIEDPIVNPLPDVFKTPSVFQLICNTYQDLSDIDHGKFTEIYADAVEDVFNRYLTIRPKFISVQPKELTQLVCTLIEEKGYRSVFNPFAGIVSYGIYLKSKDYYCQDNNPLYRMIGRIRLDANQKDASKYLLGNLLTLWGDHDANCIVSTLPYGEINLPDSRRKPYFEFVFDAFEHSRAMYAYLVTTPNICFNSYNEHLRKHVTESGLLEMVVSLPAGLFASTGIPHCLIVLNKEKQGNDTLFVDASELAFRDKRRMVLNVSDTLNLIKNIDAENRAEANIKNISERNYQWNPRFYISDTADHIPSGFEPVKLSDILQRVHKRKNAVEKIGYVIRRADLNVNDMSFVKDMSLFSLSEKTENTYRIDEPVLLISDIGKINPLYIQASQDKPVFVDMDLFAYRLTNQWVDPSYLCLEISRKVQSLGITSMRTDLRLLEFTKIALPKEMFQKGLDEQRRIYNEAVDTARLNKAKELGLLEVIERMKTEYINTVRNRKHDMKTPMTQLRNTLPLLKSLVDRVPDEVAQRLETYVHRMEDSMDKLSMIVSHLADEQVFTNPEPVNLEEILSKEVTEAANYVVKYSRDETAFDFVEINSPIVMMGKTDAVRLVQNIVDNAIKHGFDNPNQKYTLSINLTIEDDYYVIEFVNNGKPLPDGIDKEHYGMNGVKSKGSSGWGTGGFVVKSITEHYGGDYDIFSRDSAGEMLTYVIIKLPIYLGNE